MQNYLILSTGRDSIPWSYCNAPFPLPMIASASVHSEIARVVGVNVLKLWPSGDSTRDSASERSSTYRIDGNQGLPHVPSLNLLLSAVSDNNRKSNMKPG